jgi:cytoskeleton protein RodZ
MTAIQTPPHIEALSGCGQRLRASREAAGLTVDDVASQLRMPVKVLHAIEAEQWEQLGAPVFVRGQIRSYARFLGLADAELLGSFNQATVAPAELVSHTHIPKIQWMLEQFGRRLVYIVLTLSLVIPAWMATRQHLSQLPAVASLDTPAGHLATSEIKEDIDETPRTLTASLAPVPKPAPAPVEAAADLVLKTTGETWLEVIATDGASLEQRLLPAGTERRFELAQVKRLTIGNATAVELKERGQPVDVASYARSNVAHFTVSSEGKLVAGK